MVTKVRKSARGASSEDVSSSSRATTRTLKSGKKETVSVKKTPTKKTKTFSASPPLPARASVSSRVLPKNSPKRKVKGKKMKRAVRSTLLFLQGHERTVASLGLLLLVGVSLFFGYKKYAFANDKPQGISDKQILTRVASHGIALPKEKPDGIDRVQDANALRSQAEFYKGVKEGDYVISYPHLVIVYNVLTDTIVNVRQLGGR